MGRLLALPYTGRGEIAPPAAATRRIHWQTFSCLFLEAVDVEKG